MSDGVQLHVIETVSGNWFYHLTLNEKYPWTTLCGRDSFLMFSNARLDQWGHRSHLNEGYCSKCEEHARAHFPGLLPAR